MSPADGPAVRSVVLRRLLEDGCLVFTMDSRSEKVRHLREDPRVELHAWWTKGRTQFRFRGEAELSDRAEDSMRKNLWEALSEEEKARFMGPPPGLVREEADSRQALAAHERGPAQPPTTYLVARVLAKQVDILRLDPQGHTRTIFMKCGDAWTTRDAIP